MSSAPSCPGCLCEEKKEEKGQEGHQELAEN
jgi:hypothetical protein